MKKRAFCFLLLLLPAFCWPQEPYRHAMRKLIQELRANTHPDKIFVTQNGSELYFNEGHFANDFAALVQGSTQEALYYGYNYKLNAKTPLTEKNQRLKRLQTLKREGKTVFVINYATDKRDILSKVATDSGFVIEMLPSFEADELYPPLSGFNRQNISSLEQARNFLLLLNPEKFGSLENYFERLKKTDYDILFIEPSYNGVFFTAAQIAQLKTKPSGEKRLVIAYFSIGEAEDYRSYWQSSWHDRQPDWIVTENPHWKGNYIVKYWAPEWLKILTAYQKQLDDIGVDGYLLDTVDSFYYFEQ